MSQTPIGERVAALERDVKHQGEEQGRQGRRLTKVEDQLDEQAQSKTKTLVALVTASVAPFIAGVFGVIYLLIKP